MRLSTGEALAEEDAFATIAAAAEAGITVFDTARAYGDNETLLARALRACGAHDQARIVTKGGMTNAGGAWVPDGRAKAIRADCEASLAALDGLPIDLYLLHAPDPRTPWRTSVRALARLVDDGLVRSIGLANVNRGQLDEALELASGCGRPGRAQPVRRPRRARRRRRALRGGRDRGDGALAARRSRSRGARRPGRGARTRRGCQRRDARRGGACVAARHVAGSRPDSGRAPAGNGALRSSSRGARPRSRRCGRAHPRLRASARRASTTPGRRGGRDRDRHSRRGQEPRRSRSTSSAATSGSTATSAAARCASSPSAGGRAGGRRGARRAGQHLSHTRFAQLRPRRRRTPRGTRPLRLARHSACAGAGESDRTPPRRARTPARSRRTARACEAGAGRARADLADARRARARAAFARRGVRRRRAARVHPRAVTISLARACSSPRRRCGRTAGSPRGTLRISCSTGSPTAVWTRSRQRSNVSPRTPRAWSRRRCALIPAVRRRAGAGRRCPV